MHDARDVEYAAPGPPESLCYEGHGRRCAEWIVGGEADGEHDLLDAAAVYVQDGDGDACADVGRG